MRVVETAAEGLQAIKEEQFDLIISDFRLPGMNGLEFLELAAATNPQSVKVLITAYRDDFFSKALRIGIRAFIEKPFTVSKFVTALAQSFMKN